MNKIFCFWRILVYFVGKGAIFGWRGEVEGCFAWLFQGVKEKFFVHIVIDSQCFISIFDFFLKKYFGSFENGCIFASAFDEKNRNVEKVVEKRE